MGAALVLVSRPVLTLYQIGEAASQVASAVIYIVAAFLTVKVMNMMLIVGIMRAGGIRALVFHRRGADVDFGDSRCARGRFCLSPAAPWVYALAMTDEFCKMLIGSWRFVSRRWIRNLARTHRQVDAVGPG